MVRSVLLWLRSNLRWIVFGLGVVALCYLIYRTSPDRANPANWGRSEWTSTGTLLLILFSVWALGGYLKTVSGHLDQAWDEVDELRAEVGALRNELHEAKDALAQGLAADPSTDQIPVQVALHDTGPIVVQRPEDVPASFPGPVPTTVTGIPSARPRVPGISPSPRPRTGSTASADLPPLMEEPRGRHAAND